LHLCHIPCHDRDSFSLTLLHAPRSSPLFPYTTLFRSGHPRLRVTCSSSEYPGRRPALSRSAPFTAHALRSTREMAVATKERKYRSEEHTSELQSRENLVCRLLLEKKKELRQCNARICP